MSPPPPLPWPSPDPAAARCAGLCSRLLFVASMEELAAMFSLGKERKGREDGYGWRVQWFDGSVDDLFACGLGEMP